MSVYTYNKYIVYLGGRIMDINKGFSFIKICNEKLLNNNEYNLARILINYLENFQNLTLEKVSLDANISTASVSRFINK